MIIVRLKQNENASDFHGVRVFVGQRGIPLKLSPPWGWVLKLLSTQVAVAV